MERRESQHVELPQNARYELRRCGEGNALFDRELYAYKRMFEEDEKMDNCYKVLLTSLLSQEERIIVGRTTTPKVLEEADKSSLHLPMKEVNRDEPRLKQGDIAHSSEGGYVVHEISGKAMEERLRPHKERKNKHLFIEHQDVCANAIKAFTEICVPDEKRNRKGVFFVNNNVSENSRKASQRTEPHKKREVKEQMIEHEDALENVGKTLGGRSEPHHKRKGLLLVRDCVHEKDCKAFGVRTKTHLKRKDQEHLIEDKVKYEDDRVKAKKQLARDTIMEMLFGKDVDGEIEKCLTCDCKNVMKNHRELIKKSPHAHFRDTVAMKKSRNSEDERMEIKKMSTSDFRNATTKNCRKYEAVTEKRLGRLCRSVRVSNKNLNQSDDDDDDYNDGDEYDDDDDEYNDYGDDDDDEYNDDDIDEEEESDDSDVEIIESASCPNGPFVSSPKFRDVGGNGRVTSNDSNFEFRRRLLEVISKPYDENEYRILKKKVQAWGYIDYHPDLKKILKKYRSNRRKCLAIVRGFYFWIQNGRREGAFKPWNDDICLAVEP